MFVFDTRSGGLVLFISIAYFVRMSPMEACTHGFIDVVVISNELPPVSDTSLIQNLRLTQLLMTLGSLHYIVY